MAKTQVKLFIYQFHYAWQNPEDYQIFVSSEKLPDEENRMFLAEQTVELELPAVTSKQEASLHMVKYLKLAADKAQAESAALTEGRIKHILGTAQLEGSL